MNTIIILADICDGPDVTSQSFLGNAAQTAAEGDDLNEPAVKEQCSS